MNDHRPAAPVLLAVVTAVAFADALRAQEAQPKPGTLGGAWREALDLARTQQAPILAFVLPPADAKLDVVRAKATRQREIEAGVLTGEIAPAPDIAMPVDLLLRQVQLLRASGLRPQVGIPQPGELQTIFALAVPVVCRAENCGAKPGETMVLLGTHGERIDGFAIDLLDHAVVRAKLAPRLLDPDALAARRANVSPELLRQVERHLELEWNLAEETELRASRERLQRSFTAIAPALVGGGIERGPLRELIVRFEGERAPFGTAAEQRALDHCRGCGMAVVPQQLTTVLKLIGP